MDSIKTLLRVVVILGLLQLLLMSVSASSAIPVSFGKTLQGNITLGGQTDIYSVVASAKDIIFIRMGSQNIWENRVKLYAPNGTLLATAQSGEFDYSAIMLTQVFDSGIYRIECEYMTGTTTGPYGIFVQRTSNPKNAVPLVFGNTIPSSIDGLAEVDTYTFNADSGDAIYARMASGLVWTNQIRLYAPNGTRLIKTTAGEFGHTAAFSIQLDANGTYTLFTNYEDFMQGPQTGPYGLFIQRTNKPGKAIVLNYGDTNQTSISRYGQFTTCSFHVSNGDTIYIRMSSDKVWTNHLHLYAPNGTLINEVTAGEFSSISSITAPLNTTGNYTLLAGFYAGTDTGSITVDLDLLGTKRVTPNFRANKTSGKSPHTVLFMDKSFNSPSRWNWSFGDGKYSVKQNPIHTYTGYGAYTVSLNATNRYGGDTITKTGYIKVVRIPHAGFTATPRSGVRPLKVLFTDTSTNSPTTWNWTFGDSSRVNATKQNPVHTYTKAGTYAVSLNATNAAGSNVFTRTAYITAIARPTVTAI